MFPILCSGTRKWYVHLRELNRPTGYWVCYAEAIYNGYTLESGDQRLYTLWVWGEEKVGEVLCGALWCLNFVFQRMMLHAFFL